MPSGCPDHTATRGSLLHLSVSCDVGIGHVKRFLRWYTRGWMDIMSHPQQHHHQTTRIISSHLDSRAWGRGQVHPEQTLVGIPSSAQRSPAFAPTRAVVEAAGHDRAVLGVATEDEIVREGGDRQDEAGEKSTPEDAAKLKNYCDRRTPYLLPFLKYLFPSRRLQNL